MAKTWKLSTSCKNRFVFILFCVDYLLEGTPEFEEERNDGGGYSDQVGEFAGRE